MGFKQSHFADLAGIHRVTLTLWEKSGRFPDQYVSIFSDVLNINPEWLVNGRG